MSAPHRREQAVVLGASMAGLLAARVLSDHFAAVTLVERDRLPEGFEDRRGVPQGRHAHGLLASGQAILRQLFPGLIDELVASGAVAGDAAADGRWYQYGGYKLQFRSGVPGVAMSRPLLEGLVRRRVLALPNLTCLTECDVQSLAATEDRTRVTGVTVQPRAESVPPVTLPADLVVDATGRGSRGGAWLAALGYPAAPEETIKIGVGYTTRLYRRRPADLPGAKYAVVLPRPPHEKRFGALFPIEGERWMVTLGGWLGEHAPTDAQGFVEFARSLPARDIYDVIKQAEPLGEAAVHKFPSNLRRRYERLTRLPDGFLVTGDALCSFNPIYAQGMTAATLEAMTLDRCLRDQPDSLDGLPRRFYRHVARVVDLPWQLAAGGDFMFPEVEGAKPRGADLINWYVGRVHQATTRDPRVCSAFLDVSNLVKPPTSLFAPGVAWRVARANLRRGRAADGLAPATAGEANH